MKVTWNLIILIKFNMLSWVVLGKIYGDSGWKKRFSHSQENNFSVYKFSRQKLSRKLVCESVFHEISLTRNQSYAKFAKFFSHKNFNAWKSSILRYLPKLIQGQNLAQNIMISLEYHHFESNIIERNPQDGGLLMICALWWFCGMVEWSKTNVPPPRPNISGPQFENKFSPKF